MGNTLPTMLALTREGSTASNGITVHNVVTVLPHYRLIQFCLPTCSVHSHVNAHSRDASAASKVSLLTHTRAHTNTPAFLSFITLLSHLNLTCLQRSKRGLLSPPTPLPLRTNYIHPYCPPWDGFLISLGTGAICSSQPSSAPTQRTASRSAVSGPQRGHTLGWMLL